MLEKIRFAIQFWKAYSIWAFIFLCLLLFFGVSGFFLDVFIVWPVVTCMAPSHASCVWPARDKHVKRYPGWSFSGLLYQFCYYRQGHFFDISLYVFYFSRNLSLTPLVIPR